MTEAKGQGPLPPGYCFSRYIIEVELTQHSLGRVYRAFDSNLKQVVALTVLSATLRNTEGQARFFTAFRRAFYANRGRVYDLGEWNGIHFAVTEYVDGVGAVVDISQY